LETNSSSGEHFEATSSYAARDLKATNSCSTEDFEATCSS
jgi:hypothetical protein